MNFYFTKLFILLILLTSSISHASNIQIKNLLLDPQLKKAILNFKASEDKDALKTQLNTIKKSKNNYQKTQISLNLGFSYLENKKTKLAILYFNNALKYSSFLKEYAEFGLAQAYLLDQQPQKAYNLLKDYPQKFNLLSQEMFWIKLKSLIELKDYKLAQKSLENFLHYLEIQIRKNSRDLKLKKEKEKTIFYLGLIARKLNQVDEFEKHWKIILENYPENEFENEILTNLNDEEKKHLFHNLNWELRAENLIKVGHPFKAVHIYEFLHKENPIYSEEIAESHFQAKDYKVAAKKYEDLLKEKLTIEDQIEYLSKLGSSYARSDQFNKAIKIQKKIKKDFPHSREAKNVDRKIRFITFDSGNYSEAYKLYSKALKQKQTRKNRVKLHWYRFLSAYLQNKYNLALKDINLAIKYERYKENQIPYYYWKARVLEKIKKNSEAISYYKKVYEYKVDDYYTWLSFHRINKYPEEKIQSKIPKKTTTISKANSDEKLFKREFKPTHSYIKAVALAEIYEINFARDLTSNLLKFFPLLSNDEKNLAYHLIKDYTDLSRMGDNNLRKKDDPSLLDWESAYPLAYYQWINPAVSILSIDEYLALSIMKQESRFNPTIESPAQAIGLMQIIPITGLEIALKLNYPNFHPNDLLNPRINILFGTWYLNQRLKEFDDNLAYAIASYNAGPDAVNRWKKWSRDLEIDEFVDLIPYRETRNYVKKVLGNYQTYQQLYQSIEED
jgi:soluble lytic murein transglycosylase-like protein/tetratricopeptide (TPR) repeat protein